MVTRPVNSTRRDAGSVCTNRATSAATPRSMPASLSSSKRRPRPAAVVAGTAGTADSQAVAGSLRCRSRPTIASAPSSCACASATSNCPPDTPRSRCLIRPTPRSSTSITSSLPISSASAATPDMPVSRGSGAPIRTRFGPRRRRRTLFTDKVLLPVRRIQARQPDPSTRTSTFVVSHAGQPSATRGSRSEPGSPVRTVCNSSPNGA